MKDKTIVYWGCRDKLYNNELSYVTPSRLTSELYSYFSPKSKTNFDLYFKCPAFREKYKNVFVVKAVRDYYLEYIPQQDGSIQINTSDENEEDFKKSFMIRDLSYQLGTILWLNYFYSDTSLEIETSPAYHFNTEFNKRVLFMDGQFNIHKWFRPIDVTFLIKSEYRSVSIKRGDPLFYIKFKTKNNIKLAHFEFTRELHNLSAQLVEYKKIAPYQPFKKLYELFLEKKYNNRILREIKNKLTGY
jgi:hypothetical protein